MWSLPGCAACVTHLRMWHIGHRGGAGRSEKERRPSSPLTKGSWRSVPAFDAHTHGGGGGGCGKGLGPAGRGVWPCAPRVPLKSCPRCRVPGLWEATLEGLSCSPLFGNTAPARGRACRCHSGTPTQPSLERVVCRSQWPRQLHLLLPFITDHHPSQVPETSAELPLPTRPA